MAIKLQNKPNTIQPGEDADYPYGDIRDEDKAQGIPGTPAKRSVVGDIYQFFERLMDQAGITANGLRENAANGWQYVEALTDYINGLIEVVAQPIRDAINVNRSGLNSNLSRRLTEVNADLSSPTTVTVDISGLANGLENTEFWQVTILIKRNDGSVLPLSYQPDGYNVPAGTYSISSTNVVITINANGFIAQEASGYDSCDIYINAIVRPESLPSPF